MAQESNDNRIRRYLSAFADGELDIEQTLKVLERMAMDPSTTKRVVHQQQLREVVGKVMQAQAPKTPKSLSDSVIRLAQTEISDKQNQISPSKHSVAGRITRWGPIAAVLVLGIALGIQMLALPTPAGAADRILAVDHVRKFTHRHVGCTRKTQQLMETTKFPTQLQALPGALDEFLGSSISLDTLDLSLAGYQFHAIGQCPIPGGRSVHLIYNADPNSERQDSLSLWIQVYTGKPELDEDRLYEASSDNAAHPFLVWREGNLAFYLVGDAEEHVQAVAAQMSSNATN